VGVPALEAVGHDELLGSARETLDQQLVAVGQGRTDALDAQPFAHLGRQLGVPRRILQDAAHPGGEKVDSGRRPPP